LNVAMLSVSDDSVNERTQEISELMKLHIQEVFKMRINLLCNWVMSVERQSLVSRHMSSVRSHVTNNTQTDDVETLYYNH